MTDESLATQPAIAETQPVETGEADAKPVETGEPDPAPGDAKPSEPVRDKVQERFDKLTKDKYDALRRADQLEYRLQQLEAAREAKTEPVAPVKAPTLESVGYDEGKYQAAVIEFARAEARAAALAEIQSHTQKQQQQSKQSEFEKRQAAFASETPEYVEKVLQNPLLPISPAMAEVIRESDVGPQVALWLANNADKAAEIARLSATQAARELGRIEARIEVEKAKPVVKPVVSQAPPPPPKLEAAEPDARIELDSPEAETLSDAEWTRRRNLQEKRRRENRNRA